MPLPVIVELVMGFSNSISPPSSPPVAPTVILSPITDNGPFILTEPVN